MNDSGGLQVTLASPGGRAETARRVPPSLATARGSLPASENTSGLGKGGLQKPGVSSHPPWEPLVS